MDQDAYTKLKILRRLVEEGEQSRIAKYSYVELIAELDAESN